jgi:hypothetical protein
MHGGALGSGAPAGKRNGAWRHGGATRETLAAVRQMRAWCKIAKEALVGE